MHSNIDNFFKSDIYDDGQYPSVPPLSNHPVSRTCVYEHEPCSWESYADRKLDTLDATYNSEYNINTKKNNNIVYVQPPVDSYDYNHTVYDYTQNQERFQNPPATVAYKTYGQSQLDENQLFNMDSQYGRSYLHSLPPQISYSLDSVASTNSNVQDMISDPFTNQATSTINSISTSVPGMVNTTYDQCRQSTFSAIENLPQNPVSALQQKLIPMECINNNDNDSQRQICNNKIYDNHGYLQLTDEEISNEIEKTECFYKKQLKSLIGDYQYTAIKSKNVKSGKSIIQRRRRFNKILIPCPVENCPYKGLFKTCDYIKRHLKEQHGQNTPLYYCQGVDTKTGSYWGCRKGFKRLYQLHNHWKGTRSMKKCKVPSEILNGLE